VLEILARQWVGFASLALAAAAILVAWIFYRKSQRIPEPCYTVQTWELIGAAVCLLPQVEVRHRGIALPRVTLAAVHFWNRGRQPIRPADVAPNDPLRISIPVGAKAIGARVGRTTRQPIGFAVACPPLEEQGDLVELTLSFEFLDQADGGEITVLHTGEAKEHDVVVRGTVLGAPGGVRRIPWRVSGLRSARSAFIALVPPLSLGLASLAAFFAFAARPLFAAFGAPGLTLGILGVFAIAIALPLAWLRLVDAVPFLERAVYPVPSALPRKLREDEVEE